jgi:hypothetical protein
MRDAGELKTSIFHVNRDRSEQRLPRSLLVFTTCYSETESARRHSADRANAGRRVS